MVDKFTTHVDGSFDGDGHFVVCDPLRREVAEQKMTWAYSQTSGVIRHNMIDVGSGYSGFGEGKNNPAMEAVPNVGPIPQGRYQIGKAYKHPDLGPCTMNLTPVGGTTAFGRTLFRIHGDNLDHNASHGCIVLNRDIRLMIDASSDKELWVTV